jgi:hypothetical protein
MAITADELIVKIRADMSDLNRNLKKVEQQVGGTSKKVEKSFSRMGMAFKSVVGAVIFREAAQIGLALGRITSNAQEMQSKSEAVFGQFVGEVRKDLGEFAKAANRSTFELEGMAASIQDTFVPMGFARGEASQLSIQMTKLATDLASFNNANDVEVMNALQSAIVGNHETMRRFGVVITQTTLSQELLNMGIQGGVKAATEQEKVQARLNIIMKGTKDAQGDAIRTSDSLANRTKGLKAQFEAFAIRIGSELVPAFEDLVTGASEAVTVITNLAIAIGLIPKFGRDLDGVTLKIANLKEEIKTLREEAEKQNIFGRFFNNKELEAEVKENLLKDTLVRQENLLQQSIEDARNKAHDVQMNNRRKRNADILAAEQELARKIASIRIRGAFGPGAEPAITSANPTFEDIQAHRASQARDAQSAEIEQRTRFASSFAIAQHAAGLEKSIKAQKALKTFTIASNLAMYNGARVNTDVIEKMNDKLKETNEVIGGDGGTTDKIVEFQEKIDPAFLQRLEDIRSIADGIGKAFGDAFRDAVFGAKSVKDAFVNMADVINKQLFDIMVTKQITGFISDTVFSALSLFSGSNPFTYGGGASPGGSSSGGRPLPDIPSNAGGGYGRGGVPMLVGERGPELFIPRSAGSIMNNASSRFAMSGRGGPSIIQNINVTTGVQSTVRSEIMQLMPRIAEASKAAVSDANRRGGGFKGAMS